MTEIFTTVLYQPLYNLLIFLVDVIPGGDVGLAVIALTLIVKAILFPFAHKSTKTQAKLREIDPELKEVRKQKLSREKEAMQIMELYKKHGVNPFSGCLLLLIQLPVIFALYWVFSRGIPLEDNGLLYAFVQFPEFINLNFLGLIPMDERSIGLALLAGITQFFQIRLAVPNLPTPDEKGGFQAEFIKNMTVQMRYVLPVIVVIASYTLSAAIALYWATNNIFSIVHEWHVRKEAERIKAANKDEGRMTSVPE